LSDNYAETQVDLGSVPAATLALHERTRDEEGHASRSAILGRHDRLVLLSVGVTAGAKDSSTLANLVVCRRVVGGYLCSASSHSFGHALSDRTGSARMRCPTNAPRSEHVMVVDGVFRWVVA
jgi:hypothetical protein